MTERIEALEIRIAHLEHANDQLSETVARQDGEIARLTRRLDALIQRFLVVEEKALPDIPIDKPPHY